MKKMLYLFNSAAREKYQINVLNTLFLPTGFDNEYRYTYTGGHNYVDDNIINKKYKFKKKDQKKILIIFIDKDHPDGFRFYPFRTAKYLDHHIDGNQVFFRVQLGDYIFPKDVTVFQELLQKTFSQEGLPKRASNGPSLSAHGFFALSGKDIIDTKQFCFGDEAWGNFIDTASKCNSFGNNSTITTIFPKLVILSNNNSRRIVKPKIKNHSAYLRLRKDSRYIFKYSYRFPIKNIKNNASAQFTIDPTDQIIMESSKIISIDNIANTDEFRLKTKKFIETNSGAINFTYEDLTSGEENNPLLFPKKEISYRIKDPKFFWAYSVFFLLLYSFFTVLGNIDFSKYAIINTPNPNVFRTLYNQLIPICQSLSLIIKFSTGIAQVLTLLMLIKLFGKKLF
jgi:hypothetical protein